ncbi:alpha/beta hydrolase family protein [Nocardioides iriomotensis]|uniref:Alpha/beta fold hydrolase n=1 Tax=Nocardioides iriomotensis TaxID=715784 RepID=A0A4Q5JA24_9ACTN|nr:alpha/beta fold hydrolase [Nocardioides iriomotensis]RYU15570.1 alpha/beta fold hydrolase [Nocardioides iriomotensis]
MTTVDLEVPGPAGPLGATLELPDGAGPFPGVVLVSGSGPLDRDSDHKRIRFGVSRQLAAALQAAGAASLRFDKRGVGQTDLDWRTAGLEDNADDVAAAVETLRARPEVRDDAVLVVGHSEGAILAGMVAARGVPLAGVGLLSGVARTGRDVLRWQTQAILPTLPAPVRGLLRLLRIDLAAKVSRNHDKIERTTTDVARIGGARLNARWFREFLSHDVVADLRRTDVPVLAVTGAKDLQSPPEDVHRIAELVGPRAEAHLLPDVTHTLRRQDGTPSLKRYKEEVRRPLDPAVVDLVVHWAARVTAGAAT